MAAFLPVERQAPEDGLITDEHDGLDDGSRIYPPGGGKARQSKARQYIVLNRGALTMEAG